MSSIIDKLPVLSFTEVWVYPGLHTVRLDNDSFDTKISI
jgi:hypothetical protein